MDNRDIPDICLQHMVAVMLIDKTASFHAAHDKPARVAVVEITLNDGTMLSDRVEAVRGTVRNPMTRTEVVDKARDLMTPVLGAATALKLIDALLAIESVNDVRALRPLLQR